MTTNHGLAPFCGAKLALVNGGLLLVYLRDDFDHIPFPAHWDLPGGGREGTETPSECALRELHEEFAIALDPGRITPQRIASHHSPGMNSWLFTGTLTDAEIETIIFGNEGQEWRLMPVADYVAHPRAVPHLARAVAGLGLS